MDYKSNSDVAIAISKSYNAPEDFVLDKKAVEAILLKVLGINTIGDFFDRFEERDNAIIFFCYNVEWDESCDQIKNISNWLYTFADNYFDLGLSFIRINDDIRDDEELYVNDPTVSLEICRNIEIIEY